MDPKSDKDKDSAAVISISKPKVVRARTAGSMVKQTQENINAKPKTISFNENEFKDEYQQPPRPHPHPSSSILQPHIPNQSKTDPLHLKSIRIQPLQDLKSKSTFLPILDLKSKSSMGPPSKDIAQHIKIDGKRIIDPHLRLKLGLGRKDFVPNLVATSMETMPNLNSSKVLIKEKDRVANTPFDPINAITHLMLTEKNTVHELNKRVSRVLVI